MREISVEIITEKIKELSKEANICLDSDLLKRIKQAEKTETKKAAKNILKMIMRNCTIAAQKQMPICQDTGLAIVFAHVGRDAKIVGGDFEGAINEGIARGYREGYLRMSVVDPLTRLNTRDNTPAIIYTKIVPGGRLRLTVVPKGFGSENMGKTKMLKPAEGIDGVINFVTEAVKIAGPNPCPPVVVGVGIGGTMEKAALLAKEALYEIDLPKFNKKSEIKILEDRLLKKINALNIGPAGLGGKTTALKVNVKTFPTHIAGLPVAVNIGCWCHRAKTIEL